MPGHHETPVPSDNIEDYASKMNGAFVPPLMKYMYGDNPTGFSHLRAASGTTTNTPLERGALDDTAFTGDYAGKATWVDDWLKAVVIQHSPTVPNELLKQPLYLWKFNAPEMLQGVVVLVPVYDPATKKFPVLEREGRIVAYASDDIDHGERFQVPHTLSMTVYD